MAALYFAAEGKRKKGVIKTACSRCSGQLEENRIGKSRYCLTCNNEYARIYRPSLAQLSDEQKKKVKARAIAKSALKSGLIEKKPCEVCGSEKSQMHHNDYDQPQKVRWFCREHHLNIHKTSYSIGMVVIRPEVPPYAQLS